MFCCLVGLRTGPKFSVRTERSPKFKSHVARDPRARVRTLATGSKYSTGTVINGAHLGRFWASEAGTSVGTHITPSRITQSCTARLHKRRAHNNSVPVECPRGPLSMCVTTGTYSTLYVRYVLSFFFVSYCSRYTPIYGLLFNYDSSTQARRSFYTSRPHSCTCSNNMTSTQRMSCKKKL